MCIQLRSMSKGFKNAGKFLSLQTVYVSMIFFSVFFLFFYFPTVQQGVSMILKRRDKTVAGI